jgi:hypothetical protein
MGVKGHWRSIEPVLPQLINLTSLRLSLTSWEDGPGRAESESSVLTLPCVRALTNTDHVCHHLSIQ